MADKVVHLLAGVLGLIFGYVLVQDQAVVSEIAGSLFLFLSCFVLCDLVIRGIVGVVSKLRKR